MKHPKRCRRAARLAGLLAFCGLLAGCSALGIGVAGVDELLRAPRLSGQYSEVQKALNAYLGESAQLKYPTGGEYLSPFLFEDWDGDGAQDAAVFYTCAAKGQNVHLAILEQDETGWFVTQEQEGLSTGVESVTAAAMRDAPGTQLVVGYGNSQGDRFLAVYTYGQETLATVLQQTYSEFLLEDITGNSAQDLVVIGAEDGGPLKLQLLTNVDGSFHLAQELGLGGAQGADGAGQELFTGCATLASSIGEDGSHYLVIDGWTGGSGTYLASGILHYNGRLQQLERYTPLAVEDLYSTTLRYFGILRSADIDGDGAVEIPVELGEEGGVVSLTQDRRFCFVAWQDYTSEYRVEKSYGVLDAEYGYYLALPPEWKGRVFLGENEANDAWEVRGLEDESVYLSVRIGQAGSAPAGYASIATLGGQKVQVKVGPKAAFLDYPALQKAFHML